MEKFQKNFSNYPFIILLDKVQFVFEKAVISIGLIFITAILGIGILYNTITGESISWVTELSQYVTIWIIFIGASMLLRLSEHVNVDVILRLFSKKAKAYLEIVIFLIALVFFIYLTYVGTVMTLGIFNSGQTGSYFRISMGWVYLSFPVGMLLMSINSVKILMMKYRELRGDKD